MFLHQPANNYLMRNKRHASQTWEIKTQSVVYRYIIIYCWLDTKWPFITPTRFPRQIGKLPWGVVYVQPHRWWRKAAMTRCVWGFVTIVGQAITMEGKRRRAKGLDRVPPWIHASWRTFDLIVVLRTPSRALSKAVDAALAIVRPAWSRWVFAAAIFNETWQNGGIDVHNGKQ
jgi:hypothetical protein